MWPLSRNMPIAHGEWVGLPPHAVVSEAHRFATLPCQGRPCHDRVALTDDAPILLALGVGARLAGPGGQRYRRRPLPSRCGRASPPCMITHVRGRMKEVIPIPSVQLIGARVTCSRRTWNVQKIENLGDLVYNCLCIDACENGGEPTIGTRVIRIREGLKTWFLLHLAVTNMPGAYWRRDKRWRAAASSC
jgi:hypothetical protein